MSFFAQDLVWAGAELRPAAVPPAVPLTLRSAAADPSLLPIPSGQMIHREHRAGSNGRLILHIQDAHANHTAQKNIAASIDFWMERLPGMGLVAVEGGSGDGSLDRFKNAAPSKLWKRASAQLLRDGAITGEEYLNLTSDRPMRIWGIEDDELYERNRSVYAKVAASRARLKATLHRLRAALDTLKLRRYPQPLLDYEAALKKAGSGVWEYTVRSEALLLLPEASRPERGKYPVWDEWQDLRADEGRADLARLQAEMDLVAAALPADHPALAALKAAPSSDPVSVSAAWTSVISAAAQLSGSAARPGPELRRYLDRLNRAAELDVEALADEADRIEESAYAELLKDPGLVRLRESDRYLELLERAAVLRLDGRQTDRLRSGMREFPSRHWIAWINRELMEAGAPQHWVGYDREADRALRQVRRFYELVARRDEAFVRNLDEAMTRSGDTAAFLIAGGYHSSNVTRLLRKMGYSYAVYAPATDEETDWDLYEKNLLMPVSGSGGPEGARSGGPDGLAGSAGDIRQPFAAKMLGARMTSTPRPAYRELMRHLSGPASAAPRRAVSGSRMASNAEDFLDHIGRYVRVTYWEYAETEEGQETLLPDRVQEVVFVKDLEEKPYWRGLRRIEVMTVKGRKLDFVSGVPAQELASKLDPSSPDILGLESIEPWNETHKWPRLHRDAVDRAVEMALWKYDEVKPKKLERAIRGFLSGSSSLRKSVMEAFAALLEESEDNPLPAEFHYDPLQPYLSGFDHQERRIALHLARRQIALAYVSARYGLGPTSRVMIGNYLPAGQGASRSGYGEVQQNLIWAMISERRQADVSGADGPAESAATDAETVRHDADDALHELEAIWELSDPFGARMASRTDGDLPRLLVLDDRQIHHRRVSDAYGPDHRIDHAFTVREAVRMVRQAEQSGHPYRLVISDLDLAPTIWGKFIPEKIDEPELRARSFRRSAGLLFVRWLLAREGPVGSARTRVILNSTIFEPSGWDPWLARLTGSSPDRIRRSVDRFWQDQLRARPDGTVPELVVQSKSATFRRRPSRRIREEVTPVPADDREVWGRALETAEALNTDAESDPARPGRVRIVVFTEGDDNEREWKMVTGVDVFHRPGSNHWQMAKRTAPADQDGSYLAASLYYLPTVRVQNISGEWEQKPILMMDVISAALRRSDTYASDRVRAAEHLKRFLILAASRIREQTGLSVWLHPALLEDEPDYRRMLQALSVRAAERGGIYAERQAVFPWPQGGEGGEAASALLIPMDAAVLIDPLQLRSTGTGASSESAARMAGPAVDEFIRNALDRLEPLTSRYVRVLALRSGQSRDMTLRNAIRTFWDRFESIPLREPGGWDAAMDLLTESTFRTSSFLKWHEGRPHPIYRDIRDRLRSAIRSAVEAAVRAQDGAAPVVRVVIAGPGFMQEPIEVRMIFDRLVDEMGYPEGSPRPRLRITVIDRPGSTDGEFGAAMERAIRENTILYDPDDVRTLVSRGLLGSGTEAPEDVYFDREPNGYRLKPGIHREFELLFTDLASEAGLSELDGLTGTQDLVLVNNSLTYLPMDARVGAFERLADLLGAGGSMILTESGLGRSKFLSGLRERNERLWAGLEFLFDAQNASYGYLYTRDPGGHMRSDAAPVDGARMADQKDNLIDAVWGGALRWIGRLRNQGQEEADLYFVRTIDEMAKRTVRRESGRSFSPDLLSVSLMFVPPSQGPVGGEAPAGEPVGYALSFNERNPSVYAATITEAGLRQGWTQSEPGLQKLNVPFVKFKAPTFDRNYLEEYQAAGPGNPGIFWKKPLAHSAASLTHSVSVLMDIRPGVSVSNEPAIVVEIVPDAMLSGSDRLRLYEWAARYLDRILSRSRAVSGGQWPVVRMIPYDSIVRIVDMLPARELEPMGGARRVLDNYVAGDALKDWIFGGPRGARMASEPLIDLKHRTAQSDPALAAKLLERVEVFRGLKPAVRTDASSGEDGRSALQAIFMERFGKDLAAPMSPYERELFEFFVSRPEIPLHFHADGFGSRDLGSFSYQDENGRRWRDPGVGVYEPGAERVSWVLDSEYAEVLTPEASYRMMLHEMSHVYDGLNEMASIDARIVSGELDPQKAFGPYTGYLGPDRGFQGGPAIRHRLSYREFKANLWSMDGDAGAAYDRTLRTYPNLMEQTIQPLLDFDPAYPRDEIYLILKRLSEDPASDRHLSMDREEDLALLWNAAAQARRELGRPERTPTTAAGARMAATKPEQDRQAMVLLKQQLVGLDPEVVRRLRPVRDIGELKASLSAEGVTAAAQLRGKFLFEAWEDWLEQLGPEPAPVKRVTHLRYEGNGRHLIAYSAEDFPYVLKMNQDPGLKRFVRLEWIENGLWLARERLGGLAAPTMAIDAESNEGQKPFVYLLERAGEQTTDVAIVQKKVVPLIDHLKELVRSDRLEEAKRRMDEYKRLTVDMFRRGVVDTDFGGILANYGVDEETGKLVVFDFGDLAGGITNAYELTDFLDNVTNAYIESGLRGEVDDELADYFRENAFTAADFTEDGRYLFESDLSVLSPEELRMDFPLDEKEVREYFSHHRIADRSAGARMADDEAAVERAVDWIWSPEQEERLGRFRELVMKYRDLPGMGRYLVRLDPMGPEAGQEGLIDGVVGELVAADRLAAENPGTVLVDINYVTDVNGSGSREVDAVFWSDRDMDKGLKRGVNFVEVKTTRNAPRKTIDKALAQVLEIFEHTHQFRMQGLVTRYLVAVYIPSNRTDPSEVHLLKRQDDLHAIDAWYAAGPLFGSAAEPGAGPSTARPSEELKRAWALRVRSGAGEALRDRVRSLIVERDPALNDLMRHAIALRDFLSRVRDIQPQFNGGLQYRALLSAVERLEEERQNFPVRWKRWAAEMMTQAYLRVANDQMKLLRSGRADHETRRAAHRTLIEISERLAKTKFAFHERIILEIRDVLRDHPAPKTPADPDRTAAEHERREALPPDEDHPKQWEQAVAYARHAQDRGETDRALRLLDKAQSLLFIKYDAAKDRKKGAKEIARLRDEVLAPKPDGSGAPGADPAAARMAVDLKKLMIDPAAKEPAAAAIEAFRAMMGGRTVWLDWSKWPAASTGDDYEAIADWIRAFSGDLASEFRDDAELRVMLDGGGPVISHYRLYLFIREMLKNAFVHGNALRQDLPIALKADLRETNEGPILSGIEVRDTAQSTPASKRLMRAAKGRLWGHAAGVSEILMPDADESGRWSYERVPVKDGTAPIAQTAVIRLTEKFWPLMSGARMADDGRFERLAADLNRQAVGIAGPIDPEHADLFEALRGPNLENVIFHKESLEELIAQIFDFLRRRHTEEVRAPMPNGFTKDLTDFLILLVRRYQGASDPGPIEMTVARSEVDHLVKYGIDPDLWVNLPDVMGVLAEDRPELFVQLAEHLAYFSFPEGAAPYEARHIGFGEYGIRFAGGALELLIARRSTVPDQSAPGPITPPVPISYELTVIDPRIDDRTSGARYVIITPGEFKALADRIERVCRGIHDQLYASGARMALESRGRDRIGKVYSATSSLVRRLSAFLDAEETPARRRLARQLPEVEGYFAQSPEGMNYDGQSVGAGGERNASLYHHVVVRGLGQKLAGLESGDIGLFQGAGTPEDRGIRADRFNRLAELTRRLKDAGVLPHLRAAFLHHEAAKGGSSARRAAWGSIPGMDLRIPNRASGLILRSVEVPGAEAKGFFENIGYLDRTPNAAVLHEFFYRVIENRGSAGQWVRGELSYAAFEELTAWIRENFGSLSEAVGAAGDADEAARRIVGILHLFEVLDVASLRDGLYAEPLAEEMEAVFAEWTAVITPKDGKFGTDWSDLFEARWGGFGSDEDRRAYLKDRLGRFRRERRAAGESREDLDRVLSAPSLSAAAAERFAADLRNFQGWYPESATYGLSPEAMVKLIALAIAHAERAGVDTDRPYHLHFFEFMKFLSSGRHQFDPYKVRIVETLLKGFDLNLILTDPEAALSSGAQEGQESPLGAVRMDLSGQKAISFEFHMSDEAEALLRLIRIYELKSGPKYHQALKMLLDLYGLRRDEFDRVANETVYLQGMRAAASDKARLLSHGKGPVWVDIGPADGATLEIAESLKAEKGLERIVGVEISEEAFRHLQGVIRSKGLSAEAVRGDAGRLKEVLWMAGVPEPDTIIFSSVLHEVFSYAAPYGGRHDLESVKDVLRAAILALAPGGRILIRDGVVPEDGDKDQLLEITGRESKEVFDYFVQNFEARERYFEGSARPAWKDNFTVVEEDAQRQVWKVRMPRKAAMEFLFKLSWAFKPEYDASGLPSEIREQYGVMKRSEYLRVIGELAGELGMSVREVELPDAERAYLQQGYVDTLKGKAQLFDLDGSPAPFGPSNMMIVVEKVPTPAAPLSGARMADGAFAGRPIYRPFGAVSMAEGRVLATAARTARRNGMRGPAPVLLAGTAGARMAYTVMPADAGVGPTVPAEPDLAVSVPTVGRADEKPLDIAARISGKYDRILSLLERAGLMPSAAVSAPTVAHAPVEVVVTLAAKDLSEADVEHWREAAKEQLAAVKGRLAEKGIRLAVNPGLSEKGLAEILGSEYAPDPKMAERRIYVRTPDARGDRDVLNFYMEPSGYADGTFRAAPLAETALVAAAVVRTQVGRSLWQDDVLAGILPAWGLLSDGQPDRDTAYTILIGLASPETNAAYAAKAWVIGARLADLIEVLRLGARMALIAA